MTRYAALLRGVNLGKHNQIRMAELRAVVEALGHTDVATYINSGNVVFTSGAPGASQAELEAAIEQRLADDLGLNVRVFVRSADQLGQVVSDNPFPGAEPARLFICFLHDEPDPRVVAEAAEVSSGRDEYAIRGTTLYLHLPDGIGRSKLAAALSKPSVSEGTIRNLATTRKLLDLARRAET